MKILQINTTVNSGSTGRIAEDIGKALIAAGHESFIGFGRGNPKSVSKLIRIGNRWDFLRHIFRSILLDRHGFGSKRATKRFLKEVEIINPDAVGLHNIHGYYINIEILFDYLREKRIPIIWTFHDCWPFSGHCSYNTDCNNCSKCKRKYPISLFLSQKKRNLNDKKRLFASAERLQIITPSLWLKDLVKKSFFNNPVNCIHNGVDLENFKPYETESKLREKLNLEKKIIVLGVASIWDKRKGLDDFIKLASLLDEKYKVILIGLSSKQMKLLPSNVIGIKRTESISDLADYYRTANIYVNPTHKDNFPTTNIEALACGTPTITYDTGGSPEAVDKSTGDVVLRGDVKALYNAIQKFALHDVEAYTSVCRARAEKYFNKDERYSEYVKLYESILS